MAISQINRIVDHLRHTVRARDGANLSDGQLLDCFVAQREESAFEILVRRHGPMVLSVCRRVVGNHHDAEDAFQATFLVLVRKAASIQPRELVGNWLYGVAYQTALRAKTIAAKRGARERQVTHMPEAEAVTQGVWRDLQPLLDQELSRLSDKYRVPIVLCDLEGKTRKEAAQHLGVPEGTISSRLARARMMLAKRLTRHGVTVSAGALATVLTQQAASACVPAMLVATTVKAGGAFAFGGAVSAKVAILTEGVVRAMLLTKLKTVTAMFLLLGIIAVGGGFFAHHHTAAAVSPAESKGIAAVTEQAAQKKGVKNEMAALEGTWKVIRLERNGVEAKEKATVIIKGNKFTIEPEAGNPRTSTFKIDPSKKPKWFDDVPEGSAAWPGIYELDGDTLKICFDSEGTLKRPSEFKTGPKSGFALFVLERDKANPEKTDARLLGSWDARSVKGDMEKTPWPLNTTEGMTFSKATKIRSQPLPPRVLIEMTHGRALVLDYALLTTGNQKGIDLISIPPGGGMAETFPGIYQIDGDRLKICLSQPNQPRPTDFDSKRGNKRVLVELTRFPVFREIDLKGYQGELPKNDFTKPVVISNAKELFKAFPNQNVGFPDSEWRYKITRQVDFTREHLLFFAWSGSGGDKMLIRGEKTKQVVFRRQPGVNTDLKAHFHLYAISKEAAWTIETGVQRQDEKSKDHKESLQGRWQSDKFDLDGFPHDHVGSFLDFKADDTFTLRYGKAAWEGTFKLDVTAQPKKIDLTVTRVGDGALSSIDNWRGKHWQGIYTLDGNTLKICFGKERPKVFPERTVMDQGLHILARVNDRPPAADPPKKPD
jgi:RNA polymerase sigma factor (sigma-70 family)